MIMSVAILVGVMVDGDSTRSKKSLAREILHQGRDRTYISILDIVYVPFVLRNRYVGIGTFDIPDLAATYYLSTVLAGASSRYHQLMIV